MRENSPAQAGLFLRSDYFSRLAWRREVVCRAEMRAKHSGEERWRAQLA
jgi:hypothetical protein